QTPSGERERNRGRDHLYAHPGSWPDRMSQLSGEKKRTGFGSHPGRQKLKPDAAGAPVPHDNFTLQVEGYVSGTDERLKKRTGIGSEPGRQIPKPDAVEE